MRFLLVLLMMFSGCAISPIPKNIEVLRQQSHEKCELIEHLLQPGDVIFREGDALVAGGKVNFSQLIAKISNSDFSHAVIVYKFVDSEAIVVDVSTLGLQRYYLIDWLIDGQRNIVVKRLSPSYRSYLPAIIEELSNQIKIDPLYDESLGQRDDRTYCTGLVDHCFRKAGLPLAKPVAIRELPNFKAVSIIASFASVFAGIDLDTKVVIAGNDEIGLFSSPCLETVIDLR